MKGNGGAAVYDFALFQDLSYMDIGCFPGRCEGRGAIYLA